MDYREVKVYVKLFLMKQVEIQTSYLVWLFAGRCTRGEDVIYMFGRKSKEQKMEFDPQRQKAILRCSICTGEQVACFKDMETGEIVEVSLIRDGKELDAFMEEYGISSITKVY